MLYNSTGLNITIWKLILLNHRDNTIQIWLIQLSLTEEMSFQLLTVTFQILDKCIFMNFMKLDGWIVETLISAYIVSEWNFLFEWSNNCDHGHSRMNQDITGIFYFHFLEIIVCNYIEFIIISVDAKTSKNNVLTMIMKIITVMLTVQVKTSNKRFFTQLRMTRPKMESQ